MAKQTASWAFSDEIDVVLGFLNEGRYHVIPIDSSVREELQNLIDRWLAADRNWTRFLRRALKAGIQIPTGKGRYMLPAQSPAPMMVPIGMDGASEAQSIFIRFILNPNQDRLSGPCRRADCGLYFARSTSHTKVYCSSRCASLDSAVKVMREKRAQLHGQLIAQASNAIARWQRRPLKAISWQDWVASEVQRWVVDNGLKTREITDRMIRGWAKKGDLAPPR